MRRPPRNSAAMFISAWLKSGQRAFHSATYTSINIYIYIYAQSVFDDYRRLRSSQFIFSRLPFYTLMTIADRNRRRMCIPAGRFLLLNFRSPSVIPSNRRVALYYSRTHTHTHTHERVRVYKFFHLVLLYLGKWPGNER